mmetsp:Transcript_27282/g.45481  ORF Transcript_27282/g.45481 Transcript_27282/m.45481 type:complete len:163 (+) Transcript_27282:19-507(+)
MPLRRARVLGTICRRALVSSIGTAPLLTHHARLMQLSRVRALQHIKLHNGGCSCLTTEALSPAKAEMLRIFEALEDAKDACSDTFVPEIGDDGVLWLNLGDKGWYSLQESNRQLLLFSPVTGPQYYEFDPENRWWKSPNDGHLMVELLVRELMHSTSVYINL